MRKAGTRYRSGAILCAALIAICTAGARVAKGAQAPLGSPTIGDADGDGLDDALEAVLFTRPFATDTDGDGWPDGVELARGSDPLLASSVPTTHAAQLSAGFWGRAASVPGFIRSFTFVYLPDGYPASGLRMRIVVALPGGGLVAYDESYLSGPEADATVQFVPVPGSETALLVVIGANISDSLVRTAGSMGAAAVVWHGADEPIAANARDKAAATALWIQLEQDGPILMRRPIEFDEVGGGPGQAATVYLPIIPVEQREPGTPNEICFQWTLPVGYEGGAIISRVTTANCMGGWDAYCQPMECAATVGDEYYTPDPLGLIGG